MDDLEKTLSDYQPSKAEVWKRVLGEGTVDAYQKYVVPFAKVITSPLRVPTVVRQLENMTISECVGTSMVLLGTAVPLGLTLPGVIDNKDSTSIYATLGALAVTNIISGIYELVRAVANRYEQEKAELIAERKEQTTLVNSQLESIINEDPVNTAELEAKRQVAAYASAKEEEIRQLKQQLAYHDKVLNG